MSTVTVTTSADELEAMIDSLGLPAVLGTIAQICEEKADHIESNWQDRVLALVWRRVSDRLEKAIEAAKLTRG